MLFAVSLSGCISEQKCLKRFPPAESTETVVRHDTLVTVKDSLITLPADSGLVRALLECREGKVAITEILEIIPGNRIVPFLRIKNNVISTGARVDSSSIYFSWKETHVRESKVQFKTVENTADKVTGFQNFLIWSGGIAWSILFLFIGIGLIRAFIIKKFPL